MTNFGPQQSIYKHPHSWHDFVRILSEKYIHKVTKSKLMKLMVTMDIYIILKMMKYRNVNRREREREINETNLVQNITEELILLV